MRVAVDDDVGVIACEQLLWRRAAELVTVTHVHANPTNIAVDALPETRIVAGISVSKHRLDRSDRGKLVEHIFPDVAGVKDQLHAGERVEYIRTQKPVCV